MIILLVESGALYFAFGVSLRPHTYLAPAWPALTPATDCVSIGQPSVHGSAPQRELLP
jgi:hypothetical protein